ncbi:PDZ domain-containing protein, partial [Bacteroides sp. OttesenSCG-928-N06]|nr:PDZ domain-containing protein [Bacteroides sp. OttesenSCG-928-N06]
LKQYGTVQRALLGIRGMSFSDYRQSEEWKKKDKKVDVNDGVYVSEIVENGSAASADIKEGDIIIGLDGRSIKSMAELQETLARHRPGDKVKVKLVRDNKERTVEMTLKNEQGTTKVVKPTGIEILGAAFQELSDDLKKQLKLNYGVQVTGVESGKMSNAGVRKGFIILKANGRNVRQVSELEEVFNAAAKSSETDQVLFLSGVYPSGRRANYAVDLVQE